jgi:hypothetical protein
MQTKLFGAISVVWLTCCVGRAENRGEVHATVTRSNRDGAPQSNVSRRLVTASVARSGERPGTRLRWIRRLAAAEVNLAIRISAWHTDSSAIHLLGHGNPHEEQGVGTEQSRSSLVSSPDPSF